MHRRSRVATLAAATALAVIALAGCASPQAGPTATATASSAPTATATATSAPTPTALAGNVPTDQGSWIIDFDTLAGVRVGQPIAPFAQAAGLVRQQDTVDCPPGFSSTTPVDGEPDNQLSVSFLQAESRGTDVADPTLTLGMVFARTSPDAVQPGSPATTAGIRVGSTEAALLAAYPNVKKGSSKYDESSGSRTYFLGPQGGRYLVFNVRPTPDGSGVTVNTIQTSTYNSIIDVCD